MTDKIIINEKDNVGVRLVATKSVPAGHKFALKDIKKGENVIKYGEIIGEATRDIKKGEWVHTHNVKSRLDKSFTYEYNPCVKEVSVTPTVFNGYKRKDGSAGIRNEIYIIPTVGCVSVNVLPIFPILNAKIISFFNFSGNYCYFRTKSCFAIFYKDSGVKRSAPSFMIANCTKEILQVSLCKTFR